MNYLARTLLRVTIDLGASSHAFALVGGLAVGVRTAPRFTRDIDLAVAVASDREAELVVRKLRDRGYEILITLEQEGVARLGTVRLCPAGENPETVIVDLLFASCGIEPEIVAASETIDVLPGFRLPVARTGHLIAMKLLAVDEERRLQDKIDLMHLTQAASDEDLALARASVRLIISRGFARGRQLEAGLDSYLARRSS